MSEIVVCSQRELRDAIAGLSVTVRDRAGNVLSNSDLARMIREQMIADAEEKLRERYKPLPGQESLFTFEE